MPPVRLALSVLLAAALAAPAVAQPGPSDRRARAPQQQQPAKPAPEPPAPPPPNTPAPYEPQLLRLAEVLGALHHLRGVCGARDAATWRDRMAALLESEGIVPERRDRLAGAFNASYGSWARSYRTCTPAAEVAVRRFLGDASKIAADVTARYGQ